MSLCPFFSILLKLRGVCVTQNETPKMVKKPNCNYKLSQKLLNRQLAAYSDLVMEEEDNDDNKWKFCWMINMGKIPMRIPCKRRKTISWTLTITIKMRAQHGHYLSPWANNGTHSICATWPPSTLVRWKPIHSIEYHQGTRGML